MDNSLPAWLTLLEDEDLAFIKRFLLASGSLKDLAAVYQVSYPTIRLRLDRVIQKIQISDAANSQSDFERLLRVQYAEGKIDLPMLKLFMAAHRKELEATRTKEADHASPAE
jgi:hypothetical protein